MAIDNFIPEIWAAGVTQSFISNQIVIPTLNTQFTGAVTRGNQVHVINATTPTIVDYAAAGRSITAEALGDTEVLLAIDQEKAFSVNVDDVDAVQASSQFGPWVESAGRALAEDAENYVVAQMVAGATNANGGAVVVDTAEEAKASIRALRLAMANAKVPAMGRYVVVNPDMSDLLIQGLDDVSTAGNDGELRNGVIGRLYGFTVVESPLLSAGTPAAVGYHENMVGFVSQIQSLESLRNPTKFADIVRGLAVYGAKVLKADAVYKYVSA
tara:strand:- start:509 stop:1318 length:810 start_codon:yes stop_codon:yes gene_type:complete